MVQRGVSYYEIWKIVEKYFPLYVENNVMEGYDDRTILSRTNPYEFMNLNHFLRPIIYDLERKGTYRYEDLELKMISMMQELKNFRNWRTESIINYFHNSLLTRTRVEIEFIQKYVKNMHIMYSENVFQMNDYQIYRYIDTPPIDYCDLNMFFLDYFPELLSEYHQLVLKYHGDDTDSCYVYSKLMLYLLSKNINDRLVQSKILKFFHKVIELPDMDEGISPRGVIMGNGTGVISQLEMHNFNFDIRML